MADFAVCPFCQTLPVVHRHVADPAWFQAECKSEQCAERIVLMHRCGTEDECASAWNNRVNGGDLTTIRIRGRDYALTDKEKSALLTDIQRGRGG